MEVDESIVAFAQAKQRQQQTNQRRKKFIVVVKIGNLNKWPYVHQVAVLFSLSDKTNHEPVWPEPVLSNITCFNI